MRGSGCAPSPRFPNCRCCCAQCDNWRNGWRNSKPLRTPMHESLDKSALAYRNQQFLDTPEARSLRILSEYLYPLSHFREQKVQDTIVFFGSARLMEMGPPTPPRSRPNASPHGRIVWTRAGGGLW